MSALRRCLVAAFALLVSAGIFHRQIADALVIRGDEMLYRSRPADALHYYRRALWFDGDDGVAVDRFAFAASLSGDRADLREAVACATRYLAGNAGDAVARMDRAMIYRRLGRAAEALDDFATTGIQTRDPRALSFAGFEAAALGDRGRARSLWQAALAVAPAFPAARHALQRDLAR